MTNLLWCHGTLQGINTVNVGKYTMIHMRHNWELKNSQNIGKSTDYSEHRNQFYNKFHERRNWLQQYKDGPSPRNSDHLHLILHILFAMLSITSICELVWLHFDDLSDLRCGGSHWQGLILCKDWGQILSNSLQFGGLPPVNLFSFSSSFGIMLITMFINLRLFRHFETFTNIRTWIKSHKYWRML